MTLRGAARNGRPFPPFRIYIMGNVLLTARTPELLEA